MIGRRRSSRNQRQSRQIIRRRALDTPLPILFLLVLPVALPTDFLSLQPTKISGGYRLGHRVLVHPSLTSFTSILKTPACLRNNILAKTHSSTCTCNFKNCSIPLSSFFCCFMINSVYHVISIPGSVNEVLEFESQIIDICEGYKPPADVKELGRFCVGGGDTLRFAYKSSQCLLALSGSVLNENSPYNGNLIVLKGGAGGRGGAKEEDVVVGDR
ncbi:hypothetical protein TL16_g10780 [Triparma laevis f. inornata]|uniref:Uncharacterized protein n=1 Tax=Triparma laevis f. inornata TaxID=1714386 RepID=A0A9W7ENI2_9STRA|nr:hypothetical protein TL16_g10780 [Triparma laevis f. inornata]